MSRHDDIYDEMVARGYSPTPTATELAAESGRCLAAIALFRKAEMDRPQTRREQVESALRSLRATERITMALWLSKRIEAHGAAALFERELSGDAPTVQEWKIAATKETSREGRSLCDSMRWIADGCRPGHSIVTTMLWMILDLNLDLSGSPVAA